MPNLTSNSPKRHGHQGNRKIAQVRTRVSFAEYLKALNEGVELDTEWECTSLITKKHAVRYYNECKASRFVEAEWTSNVETNPFKPNKFEAK